MNNVCFEQSHEVIFRSLSESINVIGKKYYPTRGKSINALIEKIKSDSFYKLTLGGCIIEKINKSILISREI